MKRLLVDKANLFKTEIESLEKPDLGENEVLLKIDKYAFTTNNVTYAVAAPKIGYWKFFPAGESWGIIPVWGYATVVASNNESIKEGEQFYGYFPMADYLKVQPGKINPLSFLDFTAHRRELPPVYNSYSRTKNDPTFNAAYEDYYPIIKPLFMTSFLNYHFLKDANFFGADNMVLTSASSKTGLALAFMLKQHQEKDGKKIIGLTSARNLDFVKSTNLYDEVFTYDNAIAEIEKKNTVIIDFAGNADLLLKISEYLADSLKHVSLIGLTDWTSGKEFRQIPESKFFFAPAFAQEKFKKDGLEATMIEIAKGLTAFIEQAKDWMELSYVKEWSELADLYTNTLKGSIDPSKGYIVQI